MTPINTVEALVALHEGKTFVPYWDSEGYPTNGIGHKLSDKQYDPLTQYPVVDDAQVDAWFSADLAQAWADCGNVFGMEAWETFGDVRQAAFCDLCFEVGGAGLAKFTKMISAAKAGNWDLAASEASASLWARQVPHRAANDEALIKSGEWAQAPCTSSQPMMR